MSETSTPLHEQPKAGMTPQVAQAYKDATDNLIFLKREQFQITYYTWLLLAALYILSQRPNLNERAFLQAGVICVGVLSVTLIWSFYSSVKKFRLRLDSIYHTYFTQIERTDLQLEAAEPRVFVCWLLTAACIIASCFTLKIID
jgi:hypothetical protein